MFVNAKKEALGNVAVERWKTFQKVFDIEELKDIAFNNKLITKYMIMFEVQKKVANGLLNSFNSWKTEYEETCDLIDNLLGFKSNREGQSLADILNTKIQKTKTKTITSDPNEVTFRPIVWTAEEIFDKMELLMSAKEKNLKVFEENKEPLILIFIGHVDSGKSTISGQSLYLSGQVNELEIKKLKQEAEKLGRMGWWAAYIMDLNDEEKEKGKTVEMGRAYLETIQKRFTILDCPGHKNYINNMISGAAQADVACLIISARKGEFESGFQKSGQTREHAMLSRALGANMVVVCVNKMDTCNWSKERYDQIYDEVQPFLVESCRFEKTNIFWCAIEGLSGINIKDKVTCDEADWYKGKTLFETFDQLPKIKRSDNQMLRVPILSKVSISGDLEIFGKVESGIIKSGMECTIMPN